MAANDHYLIHALSGSVAAVTSTYVLYPIDSIKLRMQLNIDESKSKNSFLQIAKDIKAQEGVKGFFRGVQPILFGNFVTHFTFFFMYNLLKQVAFIQNIHNSMVQYSVRSLLGGILACLATHPFWVLQTNVMMQKEKQHSYFVTIKRLRLRGIYKGLVSSLVLVLNPIINFIIYETLKNAFSSDSQYVEIVAFFSGAFSKGCATFITYPYQVLRTKSIQSPEKTLSQIVRQLYSAQGVSGLFTGLQAKLYHTMLNQALLLAIYERLFIFNNQILTFLMTQWGLSTQRQAFISQFVLICVVCLIQMQWRVFRQKEGYVLLGLAFSQAAQAVQVLDTVTITHEVTVLLVAISHVSYILSTLTFFVSQDFLKSRKFVVAQILLGLAYALYAFKRFYGVATGDIVEANQKKVEKVLLVWFVGLSLFRRSRETIFGAQTKVKVTSVVSLSAFLIIAVTCIMQMWFQA